MLLYKFSIHLFMVVFMLFSQQVSAEKEPDNNEILMIKHLKFSDNSNYLASVSSYVSHVLEDDFDQHTSIIKLWNLNGGKQKAHKKVEYQVENIFFSPDGRSLALMYDPKYSNLKSKTRFGSIWHLATNKLSEKQSYMPNYLGPDVVIAISPNKLYTAQPDLAGRVRIWDNKTKKIINSYQVKYVEHIDAIKFSSNSKKLIVVGKYSKPYYDSAKGKYNGPALIIEFDLVGEKTARVLDIEGGWFVSFDRNSYRVVTKKVKSNRINIWDGSNQKLLQSIDFVGKTNNITMTRDGRFLAAIMKADFVIQAKNGTIQMEKRSHVVIWNVKTGKPIHLLRNEIGSATSLAIAPDSKKIAVGDDQGIIRLWDIEAGKEIKRMVSQIVEASD